MVLLNLIREEDCAPGQPEIGKRRGNELEMNCTIYFTSGTK
jgi:hypothetical protein